MQSPFVNTGLEPIQLLVFVGAVGLILAFVRRAPFRQRFQFLPLALFLPGLEPVSTGWHADRVWPLWAGLRARVLALPRRQTDEVHRGCAANDSFLRGPRTLLPPRPRRLQAVARCPRQGERDPYTRLDHAASMVTGALVDRPLPPNVRRCLVALSAERRYRGARPAGGGRGKLPDRLARPPPEGDRRRGGDAGHLADGSNRLHRRARRNEGKLGPLRPPGEPLSDRCGSRLLYDWAPRRVADLGRTGGPGLCVHPRRRP